MLRSYFTFIRVSKGLNFCTCFYSEPLMQGPVTPFCLGWKSHGGCVVYSVWFHLGSGFVPSKVTDQLGKDRTLPKLSSQTLLWFFKSEEEFVSSWWSLFPSGIQQSDMLCIVNSLRKRRICFIKARAAKEQFSLPESVLWPQNHF